MGYWTPGLQTPEGELGRNNYGMKCGEWKRKLIGWQERRPKNVLEPFISAGNRPLLDIGPIECHRDRFWAALIHRTPATLTRSSVPYKLTFELATLKYKQ
ncbi:hypothetical protein O3G_MSEX012079 [Manduca sexta]|uniref:Uncharacterized protein n=1 Tax=Manduca sexta TaxID=7130 RepID=A0A921ZNN9_MANSE|nr:hypothetical protein O3G_MSEX012079 [Manduca sexta]